MSGVEVIENQLSENPCCPHGPTILFSRLIGKEKRRFFACSACRDRKDCNFFLWEEELHKTDQEKRSIWAREVEDYKGGVNHASLQAIFEKIKKLPVAKRMYCETCNCFVLKSCRQEHQDHSLRLNVNDLDLTHPSEFLSPLDQPKKEAQFLFSSIAIKTIVDIIKELDIRNVLCVGAPRIHEHIVNEETGMKSLLLDFDRRYMNFFKATQFCWYNMFNNHFFLPASEKVFAEFLADSPQLILVTDPPFGGRMEPLAWTIRHMWNWHNSIHKTQDLFPVFFIFPYFMEPQIKNHLPELSMCDYKVDYDNHPLFQTGPKGRKHGSPVRIFTNINMQKILLPPEQGYKFCHSCEIWVSNENRHCEKCLKCTSKDGRTYLHCDLCNRCVKPTWKHCEQCARCAQPQHNCQEIQFSQACFHCKQEGHKKVDCPNVNRDKLKRKRDVALSLGSKRRKNKNKAK